MAVIGLTKNEVADRVEKGLVNGEQNIKTKTIAQIIRTNAVTFFNILFVCIAILIAFFSDRTFKSLSNFGFFAVVFINFFAAIFQEIKAKKTIDKLSLLSAPKVTVLRDGETIDIDMKDIVMDDILILSPGRQVCSDCKIVEGNAEFNESNITGESDSVFKSVDGEALSGSFVVAGTAKAKVIRIGKDNYATKISAGAKYIKANNSLILKSVSNFIKIVSIIIVPLGGALFAVKYFAQGGAL
ncbi:MAG: cation-translocating P-type ATPase, partial [Christensenellaceae bacterium]|nr:cation-translocating P-type ATPase [Christensenellaceae bacterium]